LNEAAATEISSQKGVFSKNSKVETNLLITIFVLAGAFVILGIFYILDEHILVRFVGLGLDSISVGALAYFLFADTAKRRNIAVDQCVTLAEELGMDLSTKQVIKLQRMFNAGGVFQGFVKMISTENLVQPKDYYFATSGGQTQEVCRRFSSSCTTIPESTAGQINYLVEDSKPATLYWVFLLLLFPVRLVST